MIRIVLRREIQSGNKLAYSHWRNRHRDGLAWMAHIRANFDMRHADLARCKRHVRVVGYRARMLDDDNLIAGFKHGRDCLVKLVLLVDDSPKWSSWEYVQRLRSHADNPLINTSCTVIEIQDV